MKRMLAVDTETTGKNPWVGARPYAVSAFDGKRSWWWEWTVDPETRMPIIPPRDLRDVRLLLASRSQPKAFFNAAFDVLMLEAIGVRVRGVLHEVSFKARAVQNLMPAYKLKALCDDYFADGCIGHLQESDPALWEALRSLRSTDETELHKATIKARRVARKHDWPRSDAVAADYWMLETMHRLMPDVARDAEIPRGLCKRYGVNDARRTWYLDSLLSYALANIDEEARADGLDQDAAGTYDREVALLPETIDMQRQGVCIDLEEMRALQEQCAADREEALATLREAAEDMLGLEGFNPNSTQQVGRLLFSEEGAGLAPMGRTKSGAPKTGAEFILPYKQHELVRALLRFRSAEKATSTFFNKYADLCEPLEEHPGLAILHPCFHQWGALTGRYTCSDPNLQQVSDPNTTNSRVPEFMVNVRQVFRPRPQHVWYCPDYDQVEVIIFADISGEPTMLDAIRHGRDIHTATANKVWGGEGNPKLAGAVERVLTLAHDEHARDPSRIREVAAEHAFDICAIEAAHGVKVWRKLGKTVTFTKIFGGGVGALMSWLGVSEQEARRTLREYDESFPDMRARMDEIIDGAAKTGYVVNPFGRRLMIDPWYPYRAVNYLVQSAAADLMKMGMRKCAAHLKELGLPARIAMTIHDEIIFEFRRGWTFRSVLRDLCRLMSDHEGVFSVDTPVAMERVTRCWSTKEKVSL